MKRLFTHILCWLVVSSYSYGQVKSNYEYSTTMPYGTLDLRTRISSSDYYYLKEHQTYSFRENASGVKTNTYMDMTNWDSSPYDEGHLRHKAGTADDFVMNYRLLMPGGYNSTYSPGYPLIVHLHGAVERANCKYNNCYHADWQYTVQENDPPAPTSETHPLLNNDDNLDVGGRQYLAARDLAGTRLPNDPSMPARAFPGFVLVPQMFNIWDSLQVEDVVRIVRLLSERYNIDPNRIYIQGLSIGGYAVYEAMKRASWLFAAALPMGAISDASIFKQNQEARVIHMPMWVFQGGLDKRPTPAFTTDLVNRLKRAGADVRYSLYSDLGHVVWYRGYGESDYFSWILKQNKANIHAYAGNTVIDRSKSAYPKLMLAEGFLAYQWEKDGAILSNAANTLTVTAPGRYRARFSRISASPSATQWNQWSPYVTITETGTSTPVVSVTITSPDDGQSFTAPASISFSATASVTDGSVARVEFYNGGTKLGQDTTSPYTFAWSNVTAGNYQLIAKAIDNSGGAATDQVAITVTAGSGGGESCAGTGSIQVETWTGISGREISSIPVNSSPASMTTLSLFETPANIADNYGSRVRGYLCVPTTGSYIFWIASNDSGELWLSTDDNPSNKRRIAYVSGYTNPRQWDKMASQQSASISLVAGQRYYIEALLKEGTGSDHLSVGWQLPGGALERPVPGSRLIPYGGSANTAPTTPTIQITTPVDGQSFTAPASISFAATASDSDGSIASVEFYNGGTKLGQDATSPYTFTWNNVAAGNYSLIAKAIDNSGNSAMGRVDVVVNATSGGVCAGTGSIQAETWTGISGKDIASIPVNTSPASVITLNLFETPSNIADDYGTRVRGYLCVPATGNYTFWIASNDNGELWLSTDENPLNKGRIAYVSTYTNPRQWDKMASQRSTSVSLVAGRRYYIEALLKEGVGSDHLSVGWQLPGGELERPIPGSRLVQYETQSTARASQPMETIAESNLYANLAIYPNPLERGRPQLTVSGYAGVRASVITQVDIIDMTGELVFSQVIHCGGDCSDYLINIDRELVPGVYIVNLRTNGARHWQRLCVK